jgi:hypothetical protein
MTLERLNYRLGHFMWRWTEVVHAARACLSVIDLQRDLENILETIFASQVTWRCVFGRRGRFAGLLPGLCSVRKLLQTMG